MCDAVIGINNLVVGHLGVSQWSTDLLLAGEYVTEGVFNRHPAG